MLARRALLWLLAFALVATQSLGLLHGFADGHGQGHGHHDGHTEEHADVHAEPHSGQAHAAPHSFLTSLFAGHTGTADCLSYDQLSHADALPGLPLVLLPALPPVAALRYFQGDFVARWAALFDARGPPLSR